MYYFRSNAYIEKITDLFDISNYHKKSNLKYIESASFFHFRKLIMPCAEAFLFVLKRRNKKWRKHICQKNIIFMLMDKRLKSTSRYTKPTGEKEKSLIDFISMMKPFVH